MLCSILYHFHLNILGCWSNKTSNMNASSWTWTGIVMGIFHYSQTFDLMIHWLIVSSALHPFIHPSNRSFVPCASNLSRGLSVFQSPLLSWPATAHSLSLCFGMAAILVSWPSPASDGPAPVSQQSPVENIVHFTVWAGHYWIILISSFVDFSLSRPGVLYTDRTGCLLLCFLCIWTKIRCSIAFQTADD